MHSEPNRPELPEGIDGPEYRRLRGLMRASVLRVWRLDQELVAGCDPWEVVDQAWESMAAKDFACEGPFRFFALRVAKNKALDVFKRAEAKRTHVSMDAPLDPNDPDGQGSLHDVLEGSPSAEDAYIAGEENVKREVAEIELIALAEEAVFAALNDDEREVFMAVRVDRKSRAAVGRERIPKITGQRVGQIVAQATIKIRDYIKARQV